MVVFGLSTGATLLYITANFFFKDVIKEKFSIRFNNLTERFKKNEFVFFLIYRFVGGIPFFISNILPTLFNIKIKNFFFGSILGMAPQLFVGVSLGAGLSKILDENKEPPNFFELISTPDIYLPIIGIIISTLGIWWAFKDIVATVVGADRCDILTCVILEVLQRVKTPKVFQMGNDVLCDPA